MCNELTSICIETACNETTLYRNDWTPCLEFYGEQGIEGIHSEFYTQSQHFDHVKKKDTRLRQILVNHHIATSPELAGKAHKPKERNLKRKANK